MLDTCGKTAKEIAAAIGKTLAKFERFHNAKCISIEGDSGGGGAVANGVLVDLARYIRCITRPQQGP